MIKIGYVLLSNSKTPIPSTRIAVLNTIPYLRRAGFEPHIVFEPAGATEIPDISDLSSQISSEGIQLVVFQKVYGPSVETFIHALHNKGIRTIYAVCDVINERMAELTDATVVVTQYLRSLYPIELQSKIHVIHDGIEHPEIDVLKYRDDHGSSSNPLKAVLVTSSALDRLPVFKNPPPWLEIEIVGRYLPARHCIKRLREARWVLQRQQGWRDQLAYLRFVANRRIRRVSWDPLGVYERLRRADIGIIPIDMQPPEVPNSAVPSWKVKSENRLTMKMCVGLPVIATPIPSYEPVIEHGHNGFFARSQKEWFDYLEALRDPLLRKAVGTAARNSVIERYSMQHQAELLIKVFNQLL